MNFKAKNHMKTKELEKRKNKTILLKKVKQIKMDRFFFSKLKKSLLFLGSIFCINV